MRKCLLFFLILIYNSAFSQFSDPFDDGNFTLSPTWQGDLTAFTVAGEKLQTLANSATQTVSLATENSLSVNAKWEFYVQLGFSPSATNQARIYLISNQSDLKGSLNGYFIQIGESGDLDSYDLYKQSGTTTTLILAGKDQPRTVTALLTARIQVTRNSTGLWEVKSDNTGGTTYISEGTVTDNTFTSTAWFGVSAKYTTTNSAKFFFDDFKIEPYSTDFTAPKLISAIATDSLHIDVIFDEAIDSVSAKNVLNYSLNNGYGNPQSVKTTVDASRYRLGYDAINTGTYTLTVNGIKDLSNNYITTNNTATFNFLKPYSAKMHDLVINEIFADPSPQVDLPSVEFVELWNTSSHTISLKNWKYSDPSSTFTFGADSIRANEFLILCAKVDTSEFKQFGRVIGISPWPSLNNANDKLTLKSDAGITMDSVSYIDSWHRNTTKKQGGWTLERIDPKSTCEGLFNWNTSVDVSGGSPGEINSIYYANYDLLSLKVDSIGSTTDSTITVFFNKHIDPTTATTSKFTLNPFSGNIKSVLFDADFTQATILFPSKFIAGTTYTLSISNVADCSGNQTSSINQFLTTPLPSAKIDSGKLFITEIFADPSPEVGLPLSEFIEIYNPGNDIINLDGWNLSDPTTKSTIRKTSILPKEYVIFCAIADTSQYKAFGKVIGLSPWPSLNNSSDQIVLKSVNNRVVDSVAYADSWYKDAIKKSGGWSLEKIDPNPPCAGNQNWTASINAIGGTPGKQNSVYQANTVSEPLQLLSATIPDDKTMTLVFNRYVDSLSSINASNYQINNGVGNPVSASIIGPDFKSIMLKFSSSISAGKTYTITVNNLTDCAGSVIKSTGNSVVYMYPAHITKNDILINEVLFNPRTGGADFVEIYNNSGKTLDLKDLSLATKNNLDSVISLKPLSVTPLLFETGKYLVLTTDLDNIKKEYHTEDPNAFLKLSSLPAFNDDAGTVILYSNATRIDEFSYSAKMHFPLIKDAEGVSLERREFNRPANETGNFQSAAAAVGYATPGYKNSQFVENIAFTGDVELSSKTFSPDNDGFEDALLINYRFANAGMIANATIYNAQGVLINRIARNFTLAAEGALTWTGLNEADERVPVGIYMVYFETFDLEGHVKKYRKNCVLATKLN